MFKSILTAAAVALTTVSAQAGVVKDGNTIIITDTILESTWTSWQELFDDSVTHVKLDSSGGMVYYGLMISEAIYENRTRVSTEAIGGCQSMCAEIWLAADNHVYNPNGKVGFHLSGIPDIQSIQLRVDEWGLRGFEWDTKSQVIKDLTYTAKYLNNKDTIVAFLEGIQNEGLMLFHMWYPTFEQLTAFEGTWITLQ